MDKNRQKPQEADHLMKKNATKMKRKLKIEWTTM
jgi:hypothetical protein